MLSELKKRVAAARMAVTSGAICPEIIFLAKHGDALIAAVAMCDAYLDFEDSRAKASWAQENMRHAPPGEGDISPITRFHKKEREFCRARDAYRAAKGESDE